MNLTKKDLMLGLFHITMRCPNCHSTHFGSSQNEDGTFTRYCHDGCGDSWHEKDDETHFYLRFDEVLKLLGAFHTLEESQKQGADLLIEKKYEEITEQVVGGSVYGERVKDEFSRKMIVAAFFLGVDEGKEKKQNEAALRDL